MGEAKQPLRWLFIARSIFCGSIGRLKMTDMNPILPPSLDAALTQFYIEPQPDSVFAARLEAQLRQRQMEMLSARPKSAFSFSNTKESFMQTLRARPLLAVI